MVVLCSAFVCSFLSKRKHNESKEEIMAKAVVGLYDDLSIARMAMQDLEKNGFSRQDIELIAMQDTGSRGRGDGAKNVVNELTNIGLPGNQADTYAEGVRRGGSLVAITVDNDRADKAADIMEQHVPVDIDQRLSMWREQGWTGYDRTAQPYSDAEIRQERERYRTLEPQRGEETIPVVEEELQVSKRQVQGGGMRVHTYVTEHPVQEQVHLREEHLDVERRPVDRPVRDADQAFREETFEVTEKAEQPVVGKRAHVIEEVVISKDVGERIETVGDTVRRTDVDIEKTGSGQPVRQTTDYSHYDADFRERYNTSAKNSGYTYEEYAPVYRYGYKLGTDERYNNRDWSKVEPEARKMWEERNPGTWDQFKAEIRHAWEQGRKHR
jgi:uncharacterized protein (TIGR02271 family)